MDDLLPIGEFSERSGLSHKRLRSYAACGLLVPAAVDPSSGYRYYSPGQVREAELIDALRAAGMPLTDIAELLRRPSPERLDSWAQRVQNDAADRQRALDLARRLMTDETPLHRHADNQPMTGGPTMKLHTASRTETGPVRENNEDAVITSQVLAGVADGMGGAPGGEVASAVAVSLLQAAFTGRSLEELEAAVRAANRAIWDRAAGSDLEGMGSTLCAAGLTGDGGIAVVNVGDSRAYVLHDGTLTQITEDHSVTGELIRRGVLTAADAPSHPHRGVLTRALGVGPDVDLDGGRHPASPGDRLLLCTDGLCNEVADDEIAATLRQPADVRATADALVDLALARGARDNVSVVVAEITT